MNRLQEAYELERELMRRKASNDLLAFAYFNNPSYEAAWVHRQIANKLNEFIFNEDATKLMLFVPPQPGKSELASRNLPAFALGINPDLKIAGCSYSIDLARSFNRDVQRIIDNEHYHKVFPNTRLNSKNVASDSKGTFLRNTEEFEVVGKNGYYKSVGVMGGLSGRTVDLAIIDDPIKDAMEANSEVYRNRVWEWYLNVLETRLHNKSKVLLIMTRWHEDDLAGRLLEHQPDKWVVVKYPAIKDTINDNDPREIGEPLWAERHSLEKLSSLRAMSERTFQSLYQQNPTNPEGNILKREWFEYVDSTPTSLTCDMWIDGAYTKDTKNDPTGIMITSFKSNTLYINYCENAYMEMPELLRRVPELAKRYNFNGRSRIYIEPKASGKSLVQMLRKETRLNPIEIKSKLVQQGKEARAHTAAPRFESGAIKIQSGIWNTLFEEQMCGFPNVKHDEFIDLVGYACDRYFQRGGARVRVR